MCTNQAALGLCRSAFATKSEADTQRSSLLQSTNSTRPPALRTESGVAMKVFDGQSTVSPLTPAKSSAAIAAPDHPANATLGGPFQACQAASKRSTISPSVHRCESSTSSQSRCSRSRSRWLNPIAKAAVSTVDADACPIGELRSYVYGWEGRT